MTWPTNISINRSYMMDYNSSCRLCLSKEGLQLSIFESSGDGLEPLSARILSCLSILASEFDGLPKQVCHRCECQVNVLHYFKVQCELSQQTLKRWQRSFSTSVQVSQELEVEEPEQTESADIKVEPEDIELHVEHHINQCDDASASQIRGYEVPAEGANSSDTDFIDSEDANLQYPSIHRQDDSSFNLVISGTTSVAVEHGISDACGGAGDDAVDKQMSHLQNKTDCLSETFRRVSVLGDSALEGNPENLVECAPNSLPEKFYSDDCPDFIHLDDSENSLGSGSIPVVEDPLAGPKDEKMQCLEEILKLKEEPEDLEMDINSQSPHNIFDEGHNHSSTLLNWKEAQVKHRKGKGSGQSSRRYFSLSAYHYVDLPKVNNHILDEMSKYCKICQKSFTNLWRHMKDRHAKENPFQCMGCNKIFTGRRELVQHMIRTMSKDCRAGKKHDQGMSFVITNKNIPCGVKGRYQCNNCSQKFSKLNYIMAHVRLHSGVRPFFCFKCNRDFRLKKTAANHVSSCTARDSCHPAPARDGSKPVSSYIKVSQILKRKAVKPMHSKDKLRKCSVCGKSFKGAVGLSNHLRGGCARKCFSCLKFVSQKSFLKHYRQCLKSQNEQKNGIVTSEEQANNKLANKTESDKDLFKDTKDVKKRATGPITEIVDATVQELLAKHTDSQGKRLLTCQLCERTMANKHTLYRHLIMHSSISVLKCKLCNVRMSMPSVYKAHMLKVHGDSDLEDGKNSEDSQSVSMLSTIKKDTQPINKAKRKFSGFKGPKLKCDICLKLFSSSTSLKFHKLTHKKVKCSKCEITFPASMEKSHVCNPKIKIEQPQPPLDQDHVVLSEASKLPLEKIPIQYTCHLCKKKFHTRKMLYQHKKMHIKMKIYKCKLCGNSYSDAGALLDHKLSAHKNEESLASTAIDWEGNDQHDNKDVSFSSSVGQVKASAEEKPWKCAVCCKGFINKKSYKRHLKLHGLTIHSVSKNQKIQELFKCSICDKAFSRHDSFVAHKGWHSRQQSHVESPVKVEKVETSKSPRHAIEISSSSSKSLISSQETFPCSLCPRSFSSLKSLRIHVTVNHKKPKQAAVKEKKIDLPLSGEVDTNQTLQHDDCPVTIPDVPSLSSHIHTHSENSSSSVINPAEVSSEISKQEPLQCKLCKKEYRCKKSLKYHMMGHSGEKPYKCRSCSNQYSNPKALSKHEKERHSTVLRPFSCNRCKTSFILKEDLLGHHEKCSH